MELVDEATQRAVDGQLERVDRSAHRGKLGGGRLGDETLVEIARDRAQSGGAHL